MQDIKSVIKQCFQDIYTVARADVKKHFKSDCINGQKLNNARALVFLRDVAKNPDKYFAPEYTKESWCARIDDMVMRQDADRMQCQDIYEYGMDYVRRQYAAHIVAGPEDLVDNEIGGIFRDMGPNGFYMFCQKVRAYYYNHGLVDDKFIREYANKIAKWAKVANAKNFVQRGVMKMAYGSYER